MSAPTKADSLSERMLHAFGEKRIINCFRDMTVQFWANTLIDCLTDEARNELIRRCIGSHKMQRKFAAESRRLHREKQNVV